MMLRKCWRQQWGEGHNQLEIFLEMSLLYLIFICRFLGCLKTHRGAHFFSLMTGWFNLLVCWGNIYIIGETKVFKHRHFRLYKVRGQVCDVIGIIAMPSNSELQAVSFLVALMTEKGPCFDTTDLIWLDWWLKAWMPQNERRLCAYILGTNFSAVNSILSQENKNVDSGRT